MITTAPTADQRRELDALKSQAAGIVRDCQLLFMVARRVGAAGIALELKQLSELGREAAKLGRQRRKRSL